jgi:tetratricopeptide (TPR) repeat protein
MFSPEMMEHLAASASDADSLAVVEDADIYLGVFGFRYGLIPAGSDISIAEMEYNRAVERGIPRLIFLMHDDHAVRASDIEKGAGAEKLDALKDRLKREQVVGFFKSPDELLALVIQSLAEYRQPVLTTFHYVSDIPPPPDPFIAHPYTLLQTHRLVGRRPELNLLTDWVAKADAEVYRARILNVVAVGGMGKSALTWKWFNDIAPQEMKPLAGRMWWSFYESDATFENFVTRALAYVTRRPLEEVQQIPAPDRETQLLQALDRDPHLLVLDGLERILIAYSRMDAAHLSDDDYDEQTANYVANAYGLPASAAQSFTGEHRLRKTADPRAGSFLRKLSNVRASRILVSTRLYPADLQTVTGESLSSCAAIFLPGLSDDDALELWHMFGVTGSRDTLLPLFNRVGNHPLLVQALASEVARYRPAPGDFDAWRRAHPDFDPFGLPLVQVRSHVLASALHGLEDKEQQVLRTIAAFRMPARYDTLAALSIGQGKPCADERELDEVLTDLEDRGLVGWDKRANRYDLHPLVRGAVWSSLSDAARRSIYMSLHAHFEAVPMIDDWQKVKSLEDLTPAIELYNALIGLGRYDDAANLFYKRLDDATLYRLSAIRLRVDLLSRLFPEGLEHLQSLSNASNQTYALNALAVGYKFNGQPNHAVPLLRRNNELALEREDYRSLDFGLINLSDTLRQQGSLQEAEAAARRALVISRQLRDISGEGYALYLLGLTLAARGIEKESESVLRQALKIRAAQSDRQGEGVVNAHLAQRALWLGDFTLAMSHANRARQVAELLNNEGEFIRALRLGGEAGIGLESFFSAEDWLHLALTRARMVNLVEEELPALVALAELKRLQLELRAAHDLLDDVWEAAERGPYPLIHADALNVLAQVKRDEGDREKAVEAATHAYRLAWCDGPPFAYWRGISTARSLLREFGAVEPEMPPFDESKHERLWPVDIDGLNEQIREVGPHVEFRLPYKIKTDAPVRSIDAIINFFSEAGYTVLDKGKGELGVTPTRPADKELYGSSLIHYSEDVPSIEEIQEFCRKAISVSEVPSIGYKLAFLICPHLEPVHQMQAAVYQDERLMVVPITYDWVLKANVHGDQRKNLQSVIEAFVARDDPFLYTYPVSVPGDFYARQEISAALARDLDRGQSVGLFGMRKIGKTSLIQHILRTRTGPTVNIDCQNLTHPSTILRRLPRELNASLVKMMPQAPWPKFIDKDTDDPGVLAEEASQHLRDLYEVYVDQKGSVGAFTLILDEVDRIVPTSVHDEAYLKDYEAVFGAIRSLGQGVERVLVSMVAGFSANVTQKDVALSRGVAGNPVYAFFKIHRLQPMDADEIEEMMNGLGSRARLFFTKAGSLRLYDWAGGHPFLSRLLGSKINQNVGRYKLRRLSIEGGEAYEVDERAVDRAAHDMLDDPAHRSFVAEILERFDGAVYEDLFTTLAKAGPRGCERAELVGLATDAKSRKNMRDVLNSLEVASLLRAEGKRLRLFARLLHELIHQGYV